MLETSVQVGSLALTGNIFVPLSQEWDYKLFSGEDKEMPRYVLFILSFFNISG